MAVSVFPAESDCRTLQAGCARMLCLRSADEAPRSCARCFETKLH